ncbi:MAG: DUF3054 domain-containing protein [Chloroflexota bacterium]
MDNTTRWKQYVVLLAGDVLTLALVTVAGFATHGTAGTAGLRMLTTFVPLVIAWLLVAPHLGVFDPANLAAPRQLWRPAWAMLLAGPLAAWLRGVALGTAILPVFVLVLSGVSALSLLAWRGLYCWISLRKR